MTENPNALAFLNFWLSAGSDKWFNGGPKFDDDCRQYEKLWEEASSGQQDIWIETASGALSLIILLDQIPRNIFRNSPKQFSSDETARAHARTAIERGYDGTQLMPVRNFFYLPFMHSENLADQQFCCDLLRPLKSRENYYFALIHMDPIARFGRFPHRNEILGRESTENEKHYLATGGFGA